MLLRWTIAVGPAFVAAASKSCTGTRLVYWAMDITNEEMEICLGVLQRIADSGGASPRDIRFNSLVSKIYREGKKHDLRREKERQRTEDHNQQENTQKEHKQRDMAPPALSTAGSTVSPLHTKEG